MESIEGAIKKVLKCHSERSEESPVYSMRPFATLKGDNLSGKTHKEEVTKAATER